MALNFIYKNTNPMRLDVFLCAQMSVARSQILHIIKNKHVRINGKTIAKCGIKLQCDDTIDVEFLQSELMQKAPLKSDLEIERIYEDSDILVLNKPPNIATHGAPSLKEESLVDYLRAQNIMLSNLSGEFRAGIVHRLDKQTSGALVVAKNNDAHRFLSAQLQARKMGRIYLAIIDLALKNDIEIESYIARNPSNRLKMRAFKIHDSVKNALKLESARDLKPQKPMRYAKSNFYKLLLSKNGKQELILAKLSTGRTHQIRAHLESLNRHIIGDVLYGYRAQKSSAPHATDAQNPAPRDLQSSQNPAPRVMLHSYILYLEHPKFGKMTFKADMLSDMLAYLQKNFNMEEVHEAIQNVANRYC